MNFCILTWDDPGHVKDADPIIHDPEQTIGAEFSSWPSVEKQLAEPLEISVYTVVEDVLEVPGFLPEQLEILGSQEHRVHKAFDFALGLGTDGRKNWDWFRHCLDSPDL